MTAIDYKWLHECTETLGKFMNSKTPIYEGKAKKLFEGPDPGTLIQHFKDDATAFNNKKQGSIAGKGIMNNRISEFLMTRLEEMGIPTHFLKSLNMREQLVRAVEIIPLEVIVRNYAAGSFAERFKAKEGEHIGTPIVEYCLKNDNLGDPFIAEEHIHIFDICDPIELEEIRYMALRINDYLSGLFYASGIKLIDMKFEFGRYYEIADENQMFADMSIVLADEISPDTCRLWDIDTNEPMDKDRFRKDLGKVDEYYRKVAERLGVYVGAEIVEAPFPAKGKAPIGKKKTTANKATAKKKASARKAPARKKPSPKGKK